MSVRVAVVTGSNKGIGLEIVRSLCRHLGGNGAVYLTARDEGRGQAAVALLQTEGLSPRFHQLDVTDQASIQRLRHHLENEHGGLDILVNNAGVGLPFQPHMPEYEQDMLHIRPNFSGFLEVSRALLPLIRSGGRVVNVASTLANEGFRVLSEETKERFRRASSEDDVIRLVNEFVEAKKAEVRVPAEWGIATGYPVSKLGVVVLSKLHARDIAEDQSRSDILINACCPGFVLTDMTAPLPDNHFGGIRVSTPEGADTPVYLALLPPGTQEPQGQFVLRRQVYDFLNTDMFIQV